MSNIRLSQLKITTSRVPKNYNCD